MAFGGTLNRRHRFDTRRFRRVDPFGPNPEEQAKLLGSKTSLGLYDYGYDERRRRLEKAALEQELREADMTPVSRLAAGRLVRLYLPGRTITAAAVLGDNAFDDFFPARYAPEVVVDEHGDPDFLDRNGNVVWPEDEMPLFDTSD